MRKLLSGKVVGGYLRESSFSLSRLLPLLRASHHLPCVQRTVLQQTISCKFRAYQRSTTTTTQNSCARTKLKKLMSRKTQNKTFPVSVLNSWNKTIERCPAISILTTRTFETFHDAVTFGNKSSSATIESHDGDGDCQDEKSNHGGCRILSEAFPQSEQQP